MFPYTGNILCGAIISGCWENKYNSAHDALAAFDKLVKGIASSPLRVGLIAFRWIDILPTNRFLAVQRYIGGDKARCVRRRQALGHCLVGYGAEPPPTSLPDYPSLRIYLQLTDSPEP